MIILETCPLLSSDYTVDKSRNLFFYYGNFCNCNFHSVFQIIVKNASFRMSTVGNLSITLITLHSRQEHSYGNFCNSNFSHCFDGKFCHLQTLKMLKLPITEVRRDHIGNLSITLIRLQSRQEQRLLDL